MSNLKTSVNDIYSFLISDGDTKPELELEKRKLSSEMSNAMEGLLTDDELTYCLFNKMKGSSSPGIDGFTVYHLRVFWPDLKDITREALNYSFRGKLTKKRHKRSNSNWKL